MVDNVNPSTPFHPYQPERSIPQTGNSNLGGLGGFRSAIDALSGRLRNTDVRGQLDKARTVARNNSGMVLGGLAALVIGAGLMRRRAMR